MERLINRVLVCVFSFLSSRYWLVFYKGFRYRYMISPDFRFNGKGILLYGDGEILIGRNSYISDYSMLQSSKGFLIRIGDGCQISSNVRVFTETSVADCDFSVKPVLAKRGNVVIGDSCWIGANVLINPGVVIGRNSVVGANSVVTRDVPPGEIWGGVPAKLIRKKMIFPEPI